MCLRIQLSFVLCCRGQKFPANSQLISWVNWIACSNLHVDFFVGGCCNKQPALHLLDFPLCLEFPSCTTALLGSEVDPSCRSIRVMSRDSKRAIHQVHNATTTGSLSVLSCKRHSDAWSNHINTQYSVTLHAKLSRVGIDQSTHALVYTSSMEICTPNWKQFQGQLCALFQLSPLTESVFCKVIVGSLDSRKRFVLHSLLTYKV